jgi:hypothetical protein
VPSRMHQGGSWGRRRRLSSREKAWAGEQGGVCVMCVSVSACCLGLHPRPGPLHVGQGGPTRVCPSVKVEKLVGSPGAFLPPVTAACSDTLMHTAERAMVIRVRRLLSKPAYDNHYAGTHTHTRTHRERETHTRTQRERHTPERMQYCSAALSVIHAAPSRRCRPPRGGRI